MINIINKASVGFVKDYANVVDLFEIEGLNES
jgi:hypothetical protein